MLCTNLTPLWVKRWHREYRDEIGQFCSGPKFKSPLFKALETSILFSTRTNAQSLQSCLTPWTVAHQAPLSLGFSRQEYWSVPPCPPPGDLPNPGSEPTSPALPAESLLLSHQGSPLISILACYYFAAMSLLVVLLPHGILNFLTHTSSHTHHNHPHQHLCFQNLCCTCYTAT